jgi:FKBP-type peptidyl-prolyl cis-trans isomerase SlyD
MIIEKNKVVSLIYELKVDGSDSEVIESLKEDRPLVFIYGTGSLLPKFEENISGLKSGDAFSFVLKCDDAYGMARQDAVVEIPKDVFEVDGKLDTTMVSVGNAIPMMDNDGNRLNGVVVSVNTDSVTMDFNHPLAGDDLHFTGKVVNIREATDEELNHGHIHSNDCGGCGSENQGSCCGSENQDGGCDSENQGCCGGH